MAMHFVCRKCGAKFGANTDQAGKHVQCPGCGTVFKIPHPRPVAGHSAAPVASASEEASPSFSQFFADELARPTGETSHGTECPTCGRPYRKGEEKCRICDGSSGDEPAGKGRRGDSSSPPVLDASGGRFGPEDAATRRGRARQSRSDLLSGWLVKASSVAFVGGIVLFLFFRFVGAASDVEIEGVVGTIPVSAGHEINSNVRYLEINVPRLPAYIDRKEKGVAMKESTGNGMWVYSIKEDRQTWQYSTRTESLTKLWMNALQGMGYFREPSQQPSPIRIKEFTIREPAGRTWVMGMGHNEAEHLCNMAVMLGCLKGTGALTPLLKAKRGSLAYAVFFSAMNERMSLEEKMASSYDPDPNVRTFAAEMLLSTLPQLPAGANASGIDKAQYESMLTQLAQLTGPDEKKKLYEQLRDQLSANP